MPSALQERRREQLRGEIAKAALRLGAERGWGEVTVSQIAEAVGISRRAFFTHFASKDEAVVHGACDDLLFLSQALDERAPGTSFLDLLTGHADDWVDELGRHAGTRRLRRRIEDTAPEVAEKVAAARARTLGEVALPHLADDLGVLPDHPSAVLAAHAFAGIGQALDHLFASDPDHAREHVHRSLPALAALVEALGAGQRAG